MSSCATPQRTANCSRCSSTCCNASALNARLENWCWPSPVTNGSEASKARSPSARTCRHRRSKSLGEVTSSTPCSPRWSRSAATNRRASSAAASRARNWNVTKGRARWSPGLSTSGCSPAAPRPAARPWSASPTRRFFPRLVHRHRVARQKPRIPPPARQCHAGPSAVLGAKLRMTTSLLLPQARVFCSKKRAACSRLKPAVSIRPCAAISILQSATTRNSNHAALERRRRLVMASLSLLTVRQSLARCSPFATTCRVPIISPCHARQKERAEAEVAENRKNSPRREHGGTHRRVVQRIKIDGKWSGTGLPTLGAGTGSRAWQRARRPASVFVPGGRSILVARFALARRRRDQRAIQSPDGTRVVTASIGNFAQIWDPASGQPRG